MNAGPRPARFQSILKRSATDASSGDDSADDNDAATNPARRRAVNFSDAPAATGACGKRVRSLNVAPEDSLIGRLAAVRNGSFERRRNRLRSQHYHNMGSHQQQKIINIKPATADLTPNPFIRSVKAFVALPTAATFPRWSPLAPPSPNQPLRYRRHSDTRQLTEQGDNRAVAHRAASSPAAPLQPSFTVHGNIFPLDIPLLHCELTGDAQTADTNVLAGMHNNLLEVPALSLSTLSGVSTRFTTPSPFAVSSTATTVTPPPSPAPLLASSDGGGLLSPTSAASDFRCLSSVGGRSASTSVSFQFDEPVSILSCDDTFDATCKSPDGPIGSRQSSTSNSACDSSIGSKLLSYPQVQLNGSLLSIGNAQLLGSASRLMEQYSQRRGSVGSDSKRNLLLLHNVGRTLQRTHNQLKKTRLLHAFYLFALPVYTLFGAFIFQALDGAHDDHLMRLYDMRCREERAAHLERQRERCRAQPDSCFEEMSALLTQVETCYRRWHAVNKTMTHPMSDFTNAVIYAFSVYTTIGYGTISANSMAARIATVIYGAFGIPLFFAFIKEEGNHCRLWFIWLYNLVKSWQQRRRRRRKFKFKFTGRQKNGAVGGGGDEILVAATTAAGNLESTTSAALQNSAKSATSWSMCFCADEEDGGLNKEKLEVLTLMPEQPDPISTRDSASFSDDCCRTDNNNKKKENKADQNKPDCCDRNNNCRSNHDRLWEEFDIGAFRDGIFGQSHQSTKYSQPRRSTGAEASAAAAAAAAAADAQRLLRQRCALEQRRVFISGVAVFIVYLLAVSLLFSAMANWDFFTAFYFLFNSVALIGFGDVFPTQSSVILVNMFFIVMGVVLFSMCYFILQEEIRIKAFEASRRARMSISKYSHSLMLHTKNPWSRRNSPAFDRASPYSDNGGSSGGGGGAARRRTSATWAAGGASAAFDRLRRRRQSAPVITLSGASRKSSRTDDGAPTAGGISPGGSANEEPDQQILYA